MQFHSNSPLAKKINKLGQSYVTAQVSKADPDRMTNTVSLDGGRKGIIKIKKSSLFGPGKAQQPRLAES